MILIIDNYDSFTYNLYQFTGELTNHIHVAKNDRITTAEAEAMGATHIILSPGPGRPKDAGICEELIHRMYGKVPILGICLGHQAICEAMGAEITYASTLMHGKAGDIHIANGSPLFRGLPPLLRAGRYHSLAVKRSTLPDELLVIAEDDSGEVMGIKHKHHDLYGLQFHPESILTPQGKSIIRNFISIKGGSSHDSAGSL